MPRSSVKHALWLGSLSSGGLVLCLGLLVIFGWHTGSQTLVQVLPAFVPMQYNTALGFVLCGAALLLLTLDRQSWAAIAGGAASLIGVLTLIEYAGRIDLRIDELLMKHDITVKTSHPGRMAPNTAICFTLTGLWTIGDPSGVWKPRRTWGQVVPASLTFGLAVVALSGYFTELETAYGWGNLTRMAVHTSLGFIVVSNGLLWLVWSREIDQDGLLPRWLPVPTAIGVLTATLCLWQALTSAADRISRQYEELSSLSNLATLMLIGGILLALAMALVAYLAQKSSQRARQVEGTNLALQEEIKMRQEAERDLQTHRDNLEELVAVRTQALDHALEEAETANRAKSDFLSHMSHELRTPLNGILGYAQILQRDRQVTDKQRANLESIVNCGDHLLALINDVLDLSKIEAGLLEVDKAPLDLHKLLTSVGDIVHERATRKGIAYRAEISADVPPAIVSDAAKLRQILVNLLGNAVKFTHAGQVTLRAAETPPGTLRLEVADSGVGMTAQELSRIFDPFKQVEAGKAAGGTGLGLAITKRLTDALGGALEVCSVKDEGSTFTVSLPLVEAQLAASPQLSDDRVHSSEQLVLREGQEYTILIADDQDTNRGVLQGLLDAAGFRTRLACDGEEALQLLRSHDDVDLVLMDVRMPRMGGLEALQQIRADAKLSGLKVIAVTASVFPEFRKKAVEAGFDGFLAKPFRAEQLMSTLQQHLDLQFVESEPDIRQADVEPLEGGLDMLPADVIERLRNALRIKNLTALNAIAGELSAESDTATVGTKIANLADAFEFKGLADLLDQLEQRHAAG